MSHYMVVILNLKSGSLLCRFFDRYPLLFGCVSEVPSSPLEGANLQTCEHDFTIFLCSDFPCSMSWLPLLVVNYIFSKLPFEPVLVWNSMAFVRVTGL